MTEDYDWIADIERRMGAFAQKYSSIYSRSKRELAASFEIGCFQSVIEYYEECASIKLENLQNNEFRYLTSPNGNPNNFSFIRLLSDKGVFELRQQVRVRSHLHSDIAFTPDFIVINGDSTIEYQRDTDYAKGKRNFFSVDNKHVIAAHECKSLTAFPELFVSFIGIVLAAHSWIDDQSRRCSKDGFHLAPTLFIGGVASGLHRRMLSALETKFPINIIAGMHGKHRILRAPEMNVSRID